MSFTPFSINLAFSLLIALVCGLLAFTVGRLVKRHATIDVFWGAGFLIVYLESLLVSHQLSASAAHPWWVGAADDGRFLVLAFVALWSMRLTIHLAIRQKGSSEDSRYVVIMNGARNRNRTLYSFKMIYGLQGFLVWFVSIPLQWIALQPPLQLAARCRTRAGGIGHLL